MNYIRRYIDIFRLSAVLVTFAALVFAWSCHAQEIRIVTWNVKDLFPVDHVKNPQNDLSEMAHSIKPDILCIQEVTSLAVVQEIKKAMGLNGFQIAGRGC